ncbi:MAG: shikimate dehydrogenase [Anaerolineae bacterium]|nr:shikimate dehydrogenase [Anaerolineae bacterium]
MPATTLSSGHPLVGSPRPPISGATRLVGVLGWPVEHSLSPAMHNAAFAALGLDWVYVPLAVPPERLADAVRGLRALGFVGSNVTLPHKPALAPLMDELTPVAAAIGSVNTVVVRPDGSLLGDSTDGYGFMADLQAHGVAIGRWTKARMDEAAQPQAAGAAAGRDAAVVCRRALVIGAGGAARAVVYALAAAGAAVAIANRTVASAEALCRMTAAALPQATVSAHPFPDALARLAAEADLVVNTTSLGLHGDADPLPWDPEVPFRPGQVVYDLIYHVRTPFLRLAAAAGARAIAGLGMLVHQGARSFELWTGRPAPVEAMYAAVRRQ